MHEHGKQEHLWVDDPGLGPVRLEHDHADEPARVEAIQEQRRHEELGTKEPGLPDAHVPKLHHPTGRQLDADLRELVGATTL